MDAVCAYPEERRRQRAGRWPLCPCGPARRAGRFDTWRAVRREHRPVAGAVRPPGDLTFGAGPMERALGAQTAYDRMAEAFQWEGPAGLGLRELSCGETEFDRAAGLYRRAVTAVCQGYLYAVADEGGTFLDFVVRGEGHL
ncbi:MAG: hypothetical protein ACLRIS_08745 [Flavonifractor plautii]